ncbi:SDR family oxidoreductase [Spongisporangium articulatum]|uniref:SDR family oxidoreductase n=1 Tax=Spongisporangium articulatum TaxID=3362603 RepID=A0ABW8AKM0_9ACTN
MEISGSVALVTGANRGLGAEFVKALLAAGAAKVYAASRAGADPNLPGVVPVKLDVTDTASVAALAEELRDVSIVVNNAGTLAATQLTGTDLESTLGAVRENVETNTLAPLALTQAFAPVLAANGGGAVVNVLSVLSWFVLSPEGAGYSASKAAAWQLTNAQRILLRGNGTQVLAVHVGFMDTDMARNAPGPKLPPAQAAELVLAALRDGREEVLLDDVSRHVQAGLAHGVAGLYPSTGAA